MAAFQNLLLNSAINKFVSKPIEKQAGSFLSAQFGKGMGAKIGGGFTGDAAGGALSQLLTKGKIDFEDLAKSIAMKQAGKFVGNSLVDFASKNMGAEVVKNMKNMGKGGGNIVGSIIGSLITAGANTEGGMKGGQIGGQIGGFLGPVGSVVGSFLGTMIGDATDDPPENRQGALISNQELAGGDGNAYGKVGNSAFGTFGIGKNFWFGADMDKGLEKFIDTVQNIDNSMASALNLSGEELQRVKNALATKETWYNFGMEKTGFTLPDRLLQDRYATALGTIDPRLGDVVKYSNPPKEKIGEWLQKTFQLADAVRKGAITDQQLNELVKIGKKEFDKNGGYMNSYGTMNFKGLAPHGRVKERPFSVR